MTLLLAALVCLVLAGYFALGMFATLTSWPLSRAWRLADQLAIYGAGTIVSVALTIVFLRSLR